MPLDRRTFVELLGADAAGRLADDVPVRFESVQDDGQGFLGVPEVEVRAHQERGSVVNWVLPGPRRLSQYTFGTPENPANLPDHWIELAEGPVKELLREFWIPVGVPMNARGTNRGSTRFTQTTEPTPFSDRFETTGGQFEITYVDRQPKDQRSASSPRIQGPSSDDVELTSTFADPAGNRYELRLTAVAPRPFPNYESGGGVITLRPLHGITGTGTPLMPRMFNYGAFWGFCDLVINGEVVDRNRAVHFMTTEMVRKTDYSLAFTPELPLAENSAYLGRPHHTHGILPPVKLTERGPEFDPVPTAFELPNGEPQPFIHVMYDRDTVDEIVLRGGPGGDGADGNVTGGNRTAGNETDG